MTDVRNIIRMVNFCRGKIMSPTVLYSSTVRNVYSLCFDVFQLVELYKILLVICLVDVKSYPLKHNKSLKMPNIILIVIVQNRPSTSTNISCLHTCAKIILVTLRHVLNVPLMFATVLAESVNHVPWA